MPGGRVDRAGGIVEVGLIVDRTVREVHGFVRAAGSRDKLLQRPVDLVEDRFGALKVAAGELQFQSIALGVPALDADVFELASQRVLVILDCPRDRLGRVDCRGAQSSADRRLKRSEKLSLFLGQPLNLLPRQHDGRVVRVATQPLDIRELVLGAPQIRLDGLGARVVVEGAGGRGFECLLVERTGGGRFFLPKLVEFGLAGDSPDFDVRQLFAPAPVGVERGGLALLETVWVRVPDFGQLVFMRLAELLDLKPLVVASRLETVDVTSKAAVGLGLGRELVRVLDGRRRFGRQDGPVVGHEGLGVGVLPQLGLGRLPDLAERRAEDGPRLEVFRQGRRGELGVQRGEGRERRSRERLETEGLGDLAFVLVIQAEPRLVAVGRSPDEVRGAVVHGGDRLQSDVEVLGVVTTPVKPWGAAEPFLLARPPELALVRSQLKHGNLVRLHVGEKPFIRVHSVVSLLEGRHGLIDRVGVLEGLADPRGESKAVDVELRLLHGRLGDQEAGVVQIVVHARLDAAGIGLHHHTVALLGFDVEPDVEVADEGQAEHRDMAEDDLAVGRRGAGRGEGAAMFGGSGSGREVGGFAELFAFEARRRGLERGVEEFELDVGVDRDHVEEVNRSAKEPGPGGGRAVGDPLHLFEIFLVVAPQEEGVDHRPGLSPGVGRGGMASLGGKGQGVIGDLGRQQPTMLVAALIGSAFNMEDRPAGARITICRSITAHGGRVRLLRRRRWIGLRRAREAGGERCQDHQDDRGSA